MNDTEANEKLAKIMREQDDVGKLLVRRDLALSRANEKLRALDNAKSEFISIAAHQLRTPLSAMKWILSMLVNKEIGTEKEIQVFTQRALESCERMILLVNDLLEVDHIQSGKDQFIFKPVDLNTLVQSVIQESSSKIEERKLQIHHESCENAIVDGDAEKLRGLCQNLLENAIKYTPVEGTIFFNIQDDDKHILMTIKDSGIGIPPEDKERIFTKFFRARNALRMDTVGSGLGLFIVKQIVERHGGNIRFDSDSTGTTFFVSLPKPSQLKVNPV